jgi:EAL domain-containing protein (putative c-di-GMP-specific phosphodiesterase class I)
MGEQGGAAEWQGKIKFGAWNNLQTVKRDHDLHKVLELRGLRWKEGGSGTEWFKIPAENIYLEISENIFIGDHWDIFTIMHKLKNYGFKLVLDNFGTGYSSLKHLRELPIDVIKIDRTFIRYLVEDERDSAIVKNIINLASNLKTEFIVVGVETQAQVKLLKQLGCLIFQGDYYSKPLDHQQLEAYFEHYL